MAVGGVARWIGAAVLPCIVGLTACGSDDTPPTPTMRWECPSEWVPAARGGCAPALLACPEGEGHGDACEGFDPETPGPGTGIHRRADGSLGGAWDGAPGEPPAVDPAAGIPSCLEGWRRLDDGTCDPSLPESCPEGGAPLPGGACTRTSGDDCPAGALPEIPAEADGETVVYVSKTADPSVADGTPSAPFARIADGLAAAAGGWVLVGDGTYAEALVIDDATHVVGTCARRVTIGAGDDTPAVDVRGTTLDLRSVTVEGGRPGVRVRRAGHLTLRNAVVEDALERGVDVAGTASRGELRDVVVRGTRLVTNTSAGVWAESGATVSIERSSIAGSFESGVLAYMGAGATIEGSVISGTTTNGSGKYGNALWAEGGSTIEATGVLFDANARHAYVNGEGSLLSLVDSVFDGGGVSEGGLASVNGGEAVARRTLVRDVTAFGILTGSGTATVTDCVVRDIPGGTFMGALLTHGIGATIDGELTAEGVIVEGINGFGVSVTERGHATVSESRIGGLLAPDLAAVVSLAEVELYDVVLEDNAGGGVEALEGGTLRGERILVRRSHHVGAAASDPGSTIELRDSAILHTTAPAGGTGGAVVSQRGAAVTLERTLLEDAEGVGVGGTHDAAVALTDVRIRDIRPDPAGRISGRGLEVNRGAVATLTRVAVERTHGIGLAATEGGDIGAEDVSVRETGTGEPPIAGWGIAASGSGRFEGRRIVVSGATEAGAIAVGPASMTIEDAFVSDVTPSTRGYGVGIAAFGATVEATRVSVRRVAGAGALATPYEWHGTSSLGRMWLTDASIGSVGTSTLALSADLEPTGRPAAYGLHVGAGCGLQAERFVVDESGYGVFAAEATTILRTGVVSRQLDAAGAVTPDPGDAELHTAEVAFVDNAVDEIVPAPSDLPAAAALPEPSPICVDDPCE